MYGDKDSKLQQSNRWSSQRVSDSVSTSVSWLDRLHDSVPVKQECC